MVPRRPAAPEFLRRITAVREILTSKGRTLAQGALASIWARRPGTIPIPGCRTTGQVDENAGALAKGPLTAGPLDEISMILTDRRWTEPAAAAGSVVTRLCGTHRENSDVDPYAPSGVPVAVMAVPLGPGRL